MLHDHMINFFEAAVVFLVLTNAASLLAFAGAKREPMFRTQARPDP